MKSHKKISLEKLNQAQNCVASKSKIPVSQNFVADQFSSFPAQCKTSISCHDAVVQRQENTTGLPDNLKSGIESLSGISMDDVSVHYNSSKPAQLKAHAFAQGSDIHLASGQEKHLPHEAWHVVQQKQGRVKPTTQFMAEVKINDDTGLEQEADIMGAKAAVTSVPKSFESKPKHTVNKSCKDTSIQLAPDDNLPSAFKYNNLIKPKPKLKQRGALKGMLPKKTHPKRKRRGMVNAGKTAGIDLKSWEAGKFAYGDTHSLETVPAIDLHNLSPGESIMNNQIPALAAALGYEGVTAKDINRGMTIRYWVVDNKKGYEIEELGGLMLRPVIMMSDVLASGQGLVTGVKVFRGDSRGPVKGWNRSNKVWNSESRGVLDTGFRAYKNDSDIFLHQLGANNSDLQFYEDRSSAYVSTSTQLSVATTFAGDKGWIYTMKIPYGIHVVTALGKFNAKYQSEDEIIVPYGIDPGAITFFFDPGDPLNDNKSPYYPDNKEVKKYKKWLTKKNVEQIAKENNPNEENKKRLDKANETRQKYFISEQVQSAFIEKTGGGGGGLLGIDWQLISKAKEWETFARVTDEGKVKSRTAKLDAHFSQHIAIRGILKEIIKENSDRIPISVSFVQHFVYLRSELKFEELYAEATYIESLLKKLIRNKALHVMPNDLKKLQRIKFLLEEISYNKLHHLFFSIEKIIKAKPQVVGVSPILLKHLTSLRSELKVNEYYEDGTYIESLRKKLIKNRKIQLTSGDHKKLKKIHFLLRGSQYDSLKAVLAAKGEKIQYSDALKEDLTTIASKAKKIGFAAYAAHIVLLRNRLNKERWIQLSVKERDHLKFIMDGLLFQR